MKYLNNPVYEKDLWSINRSRGFFWAFMAIHVLIAAIALAVFANTIQYIRSDSSWDYSSMLQLYIIISIIECTIIVLLMPGVAGVSICQERENGNLDIWKASGISPLKIVLGKLFSSVNVMIVMLVTSLPVFSLVYVYGGIEPKDMFLMIILIGFAGLQVCALSVACSAVCKKSAAAVLMSYGFNAALLLGTYLVHAAPMLMYSIDYGEELGRRIDWYHYFLLLNPLISVYDILNSQAGSRSAIFGLINYQGNYRQNWVTQNWIGVSTVLQLTFIIICIVFAVRRVKADMSVL